MTAPPHVCAQRRKRRLCVGALLTLAVLGALSFADHRGLLLYQSRQLRYHGRTFDVVRVIDGDTLDIAAPDGDKPYTRVRLWGLDAPEIAHPPQYPEAEPYGDAARAALAAWCEGKQVTLEIEPHHERGRFGRLVAHVKLLDGAYVNERLLSEGLARLDTRWSHSRLERYDLLEKQARYDKVGVWSQ